MPKHDEEFLESLIGFTEESLVLFSPSEEQKVEREKMVTRALLRCIDLPFNEAELYKGTYEPTDIAFRSACFQLVEIQDQGRRRGTDLKTALGKFKQASAAEQVSFPCKTSLSISFFEVASLVVLALKEKFDKYGGTRGCSGIDALVYINLRERHLVIDGLSDAKEELAAVKSQGWRSLSIVFIPYGIVWFATDNAPEFLKKLHGKTLINAKMTDGWFEPDHPKTY